MRSFEPNTHTVNRNKRYLLFRMLILIALGIILVLAPRCADIMASGSFAENFSPLHIF